MFLSWVEGWKSLVYTYFCRVRKVNAPSELNFNWSQYYCRVNNMNNELSFPIPVLNWTIFTFTLSYNRQCNYLNRANTNLHNVRACLGGAAVARSRKITSNATATFSSCQLFTFIYIRGFKTIKPKIRPNFFLVLSK